MTANNVEVSSSRSKAEFSLIVALSCCIFRGETPALACLPDRSKQQSINEHRKSSHLCGRACCCVFGLERSTARPSAPVRTVRRVQEFDAQLKKMMDGDVTLVSSLGQVKLALEAAIKSAFQTPEVIRMFAKREPAALRARLAKLQEDHKLGRLPTAAFRTNAVEVLVALKKLGEEVRRGFAFVWGMTVSLFAPLRLYASFCGTIARL